MIGNRPAVSRGTLHRFLLRKSNFSRALHACVLWLISLNSLQLYCSNITIMPIPISQYNFKNNSNILRLLYIKPLLPRTAMKNLSYSND